MKNKISIPNHFTTTLVVLLLLIIWGITACNPQEDSITIPQDAQAGDLVNLEPCTYQVKSIDYPADCGILIVSENRSDPNSRLIALPVIRVRATSDNTTEPIFWVDGGPGRPNLLEYSEDGLFENHDFVMVGYRGVEGSVVLECPEVSDAIRNAPGSLLSDESLAAYGDGASRCAERLQAEGVDLAGYTITETIDDMEDARQALGYERINLYGNSYGTRLQQIYAWRYPESLHRVLMVAVNPPGHFIWDSAVTDAQVADYGQLCAQDAECSSRTDNLVETIRDVSDNLPERWLFFPIDEGVVYLLTYFMFVESVQPSEAPVPLSSSAAIDMWLDAAEGDFSGMALISMSSNLFLPDLFTWGHFLAMGGSVKDYRDPDRDYQAELNPVDALIGAPLSQFLWGMTQGWPKHTISEEYFQVQPSDVEMLLVSGNVDFSTPPQFATEELLPHLSNAQQIILKDNGHTESFWQNQPEARAHLVSTFFNTGEVDDSRYTYQPVDFAVERSWSGLAKTFFGIAIFAIVLLTALIGLVVWLVRRRRKV